VWASARRGWLQLCAEYPRENDKQRHARWVGQCGPRLKAAHIGASLRNARRLARWNPAKAMYRWLAGMSGSLRAQIEAHVEARAESAAALFRRFNLIRFCSARTFRDCVCKRRRELERSELAEKYERVDRDEARLNQM
jgi:hypothetical protein